VKLQKETVLSLVKGSTVFINYLGGFIPLLVGLSFIPLLIMMVFSIYYSRNVRFSSILAQENRALLTRFPSLSFFC